VNDFNLWFSTGLTHIADWQAYDHILFLIVLCSVYTLKEIKKVMILITSFTIGHSITLALSVLSIISIKRQWIEFLIPITILFTAALNLYLINRPTPKNFKINYFFALLFGCIHGMGFSLLLKSLLGKSETIIQPLLAFNLGLETGQAIIILAILLIFASLNILVKVEERVKKIFISSVAFGIATIMAIERLSILINS
jgi:hypothetical protein